MIRLTSGSINRKIAVGQGDIIHRPPSEKLGKHSWGFIATADCDIAQDKSGARLSYLEVVTVHDYIENIWAAEVIRKLKERTIADAAALITKATQEIDASFDATSPEELLDWLAETSVEELLKVINVEYKKRKQYLDALNIVELVFNLRGSSETALQRLRRIWSIQGLLGKAMRARLEQALDYNKSTDFHLIPSLPGSDCLGYIVLLREVYSIRNEDIHKSALDLQINGGEGAYYIAGPLSDNLRYAISQKMAYMFSRIGMSLEYESHCEIVTQLAIDEILSRHDV
ncbi:hypothetical protein [Methylobacterium indicum]|uniref:hypothetical protein n=1 Tax=Methylobacterium indicum TaxID=1775910 RepID=UPI002435DBD4|nr:hypothetical protein [Methylobacterium indicum]